MANHPLCPRCGGRNIASIRYGKQAINKALEKALADKTIVLGGCAGDKSASKHCNDCGHRW